MLLLTNGTIATMDPARPMAEAAVVDGGTLAESCPTIISL